MPAGRGRQFAAPGGPVCGRLHPFAPQRRFRCTEHKMIGNRTSFGGNTMNSKRVGVIAASVLAAIGLMSCQTPYHDQNERYVFVASNVHLPYWQETQASLIE